MTSHRYTCPSCLTRFDIDEFLEHDEIVPVGMHIDPDDPELQFFFFEHQAPQCGGSFALPIRLFTHLIEEAIPEKQLSGNDECEHHCIETADMATCQQSCHFAPYRRFLLSMLESRSRTRVNA